MFVSYQREKLLNAIIYFVKNTRHCHTLKLFKLLNFLDFEHFRQTGSSVTGLKYVAWPEGPAPVELWHELRAPKEDLTKAVAIVPIRDEFTARLLRRDIMPRRKFDPQYFSRRELKIIETLAFIFKDALAHDMSGVSHAKKLPWGRVYKDGEGKNKTIPYELSLESETIIKDMSTLDADEYAYRSGAFREIDVQA